MTTPKIATCCYCGTRATLVLRGTERHELSCSNCGAPLHNLKMLRADHHGQRELVKSTRKREPERREKPKKRAKPQKRRKSFKRRLLEEAFDVLEDIFD